jgi:hypothetical protein
MSTRIIFATLFSAALISSYSSAIAADVRPEVAQPLDDARVLANGGTSDKATIVAKLNQAASIPNLNSNERHKIAVTRDYVISRVGQFVPDTGRERRDRQDVHPITSLPNYSQTLGYTGLRDRRSY